MYGGASWKEVPSRTRWIFVLVMTVAGATGLTAGWAFANDHEAIGVAILVGVYIVPSMAMIPIRIRRANRMAAAAREKRLGMRDP